MPHSAILLIHCVDKEGLVASITEFIFKNNGNIIYCNQHVDTNKKVFFMRVEWELQNFAIPWKKIGEYFQTLVADKLNVQWELHFSDETPKVAIFVSKFPHCLNELLSCCQSPEWGMEISLIISNHPDLKEIADRFDIDYHAFNITKENKKTQEQKQLALLKKHHIDFIVLARYMQILSEDFVANYPNKIINIHHSFLPAFAGARPYHSAYERGVKIIGATSHYVTPELDKGPIIEQDIVRITHRDAVNDLKRKGQDLEKIVLTRAIWNHIRHKILVYNNRTIIFD
ncbi:MAG: formyltetrahydrofolate deformylase [bacterium]